MESKVDKYRLPEDRVVVIPNFYDPEDFQGWGKTNRKSKKFTITYVGSFYGLRTPEPFLMALKSLRKEYGWRFRIIVLSLLPFEVKGFKAISGVERLLLHPKPSTTA